MGAKYTKGQADATAKYMSDKHMIRVVTPQEKAAEYKAEAKAEDKSLNQFIVDCVDSEIEAKKGKNPYTREMAALLGEVYQGILKTMNKKGNDPCWTTSDRYPFKCLIMLLPRAIMIGVPPELDKKIATLMSMIEPDEVGKLMTVPMPMQYQMDYEKGIQKSVADSKKGQGDHYGKQHENMEI